MVYVTKEKIILGLFSLGFDKIDNLLYTYTLSEILKNNEFKFLKKDFSMFFKQNISYDGIIYETKNDNVLISNLLLTDYLSKLNFKTIIDKKLFILGYGNLDNYNYLISDREKRIMNLNTYTRRNIYEK
mgnify:FL=1